MQLQLGILNKNELIRACELVGCKNKNNELRLYNEMHLRELILEKVNPHNRTLRDQYIRTLTLFKIPFRKYQSDRELKEKLYKFNCKKLEEYIAKMSSQKKQKLMQQLEDTLDDDVMDILKKHGKFAAKGGAGILVLNGGAVVLNGSNLGICVLLTSSLSSISSLIGITFPFGYYAAAAVAGGKIIAIGNLLANPYIAIPLFGFGVFVKLRDNSNKQYIKLAGINYLIESKKQLEI